MAREDSQDLGNDGSTMWRMNDLGYKGVRRGGRRIKREKKKKARIL
jgi:hypothetical protein